MSLLTKVLFYPTLGYNILMTYISSRRWFDRIDETVILGALPLKSWNKILVEEEKVRAIVSLTEDIETEGLTNSVEEWKAMGVEVLKLPTPDFVASPSQEYINKGVSFILKHRQKRNSVYVHCKAGRTRSTTIVACYLMKVNKWKPQEAVEFIQSKRPHIWLRETQMDSINIYYDNLKNSRISGA
ncbi:phosphatidylglycerophosphatase and protein-tyrosine phosphatase 1-like [Saccostrea echinata]|uniref:phosphatidylglycerophosphatase and protein-tyrosine phosphatase 1-like n=1 Tax=Saccostrea echinata TaxID=191078 RepID=UPI002A802BA1|nr:phosphatidylglycerophosphatase and protein-tyrosine phosphatase 1-like [Saccostrea echinata]